MNRLLPFTMGFRAMAIILAVSSLMVIVTACAGDYARKRAKRYYLQGQNLVNRGDTDRAIKKFEKSMALSEKTGFDAGIAHNLNELAIIHTTRGEFETARSELDRALDIYRARNMIPEVSKTLNNRVQTYVREGRFKEAIFHYKMLVEWDEQTDNRLGMAISLYNMALIYDRRLGDREKASDAYNRSVEIFRETGNEKYLKKLQGR